MQKIDLWPPPEWTEVVILWTTMLEYETHNPNKILSWVDNHPGGKYHLHGYNATEGFAFRFEDPNDAALFVLRWV